VVKCSNHLSITPIISYHTFRIIQDLFYKDFYDILEVIFYAILEYNRHQYHYIIRCYIKASIIVSNLLLTIYYRNSRGIVDKASNPTHNTINLYIIIFSILSFLYWYIHKPANIASIRRSIRTYDRSNIGESLIWVSLHYLSIKPMYCIISSILLMK